MFQPPEKFEFNKMDSRCLQHDHRFDESMIYDEDGNYLPREFQMQSRCWTCGITMQESFGLLNADIESGLKRNLGVQ